MAVASLQRRSAMKSCLSNTSLSFCCFSPGSTSKCHHAAWQCVLLGHTMTWTPSAASPLLALSLSLSVSRHLNICLIIGGVFKHPWNALFLEFKLLKILFLFFFFFIIMCFMSGRWASAGAAGNTQQSWTNARFLLSHESIPNDSLEPRSQPLLHHLHCSAPLYRVLFYELYRETERERDVDMGGLVSKWQSEHTRC